MIISYEINLLCENERCGGEQIFVSPVMDKPSKRAAINAAIAENWKVITEKQRRVIYCPQCAEKIKNGESLIYPPRIPWLSL